MKARDRKEQRQQEAEARAEERAQRTDKEQLQRLIDRGAANCKEALRLMARSELVIFDEGF